MSRIIASAAIRGAHKIAEQAEQMLVLHTNYLLDDGTGSGNFR
jgi:hypothetical protein